MQEYGVWLSSQPEEIVERHNAMIGEGKKQREAEEAGDNQEWQSDFFGLASYESEEEDKEIESLFD